MRRVKECDILSLGVVGTYKDLEGDWMYMGAVETVNYGFSSGVEIRHFFVCQKENEYNTSLGQINYSEQIVEYLKEVIQNEGIVPYDDPSGLNVTAFTLKPESLLVNFKPKGTKRLNEMLYELKREL